jgi:hypothetical protein
MKTQIRSALLALFGVLCLTLAALPALADTLYDNGPVNGNTNAWQINGGFVVSDSFSNPPDVGGKGLSAGKCSIWESPGDTLTSLDWSITSAENGGTVFGSGTASGASLTDQFLFTNQYGYDIDLITVSDLNVTLGPGTYWLNLQSAISAQGNPVYWDENSGPSQAYDSALGTIPSEAFTIYGSASSTPEPSSLFLLGSGVLGISGLLRKRLHG